MNRHPTKINNKITENGLNNEVHLLGPDCFVVEIEVDGVVLDLVVLSTLPRTKANSNRYNSVFEKAWNLVMHKNMRLLREKVENINYVKSKNISF